MPATTSKTHHLRIKSEHVLTAKVISASSMGQGMCLGFSNLDLICNRARGQCRKNVPPRLGKRHGHHHWCCGGSSRGTSRESLQRWCIDNVWQSNKYFQNFPEPIRNPQPLAAMQPFKNVEVQYLHNLLTPEPTSNLPHKDSVPAIPLKPSANLPSKNLAGIFLSGTLDKPAQYPRTCLGAHKAYRCWG